jgi:hypothetical protein
MAAKPAAEQESLMSHKSAGPEAPVNPSTGLPMANAGLDVEGNPYGHSRALSDPEPVNWPEGSTLDLGLSFDTDW